MAIETSIKTEFEHSLAPYRADFLRDLPWRQLAEDREQRFYQVLVSEIMLQQTQVKRVIEKYNQWMVFMPTITSAAANSRGDFITMWQGLGYNRRAGYLYDIVRHTNARAIPKDLTTLSTFKGIGINTAHAISVYCDNTPSLFIETNIRTVVIHHFFKNEDAVSDKQIALILDELLPKDNPRMWYWALMDYGTELKRQKLGSIKNSSQYRKQSKFKGSRRELRGRILRAVAECRAVSIHVLRDTLKDDRYDEIIKDLIAEDLLWVKNGKLVLP